MTGTRQRVDAAMLREVLALIAAGHTNGRIGRALGVSEETAKWRVRLLCEDLGASGRAHAVAIGYQQGYLGLGEHALVCALRRPRVCDCKDVPR